MADKTGIEWTDATWNPLVGCSLASPGCTNCYAMSMAARIERMTPGTHYVGTTQASKAGPAWTGLVKLAPDHILTRPLRWKRPRKIFVNSMSDLFHESMPDEWIDKAFAVMALAPHHTFQVLTKRSTRMREYFASRSQPDEKGNSAEDIRVNMTAWAATPSWRDKHPAVAAMIPSGKFCAKITWPLPNVWLGVSVEDQKRADERIPDLLATPAAVRWISAEPLLELVDLSGLRKFNARGEPWINALLGIVTRGDYLARSPSESSMNTRVNIPGELSGLDWVVVGSESGRSARVCAIDWVREIRDQCVLADVPFFWKQHAQNGQKIPLPTLDGRQWLQFPATNV